MKPVTVCTTASAPAILPHLGDRLRLRDEIGVGAAAGPVVHRRDVGDPGEEGHVEPAGASQTRQHLGRLRVDRDDDVGTRALDQRQQPGRAEPRQQALREDAGGDGPVTTQKAKSQNQRSR